MIDKEKYIARLEDLIDSGDVEIAHTEADDILCELLYELGYQDILKMYKLITKWYA